MDFKDLSDELKEEAKACKTPEEFMGFCKNNLITLKDEELEALAGGEECPDWGLLCLIYHDCGVYLIPPEEIPYADI